MVKTPFFSYTLVFSSHEPLEPLRILPKILIQTVRVVSGAKLLPKSSSLCIGCNNVTDRQTDRKTTDRQIDRRTDDRQTAHAISWLGYQEQLLAISFLEFRWAVTVEICRFHDPATFDTLSEFRISYATEPGSTNQFLLDHVSTQSLLQLWLLVKSFTVGTINGSRIKGNGRKGNRQKGKRNKGKP